MQGRQIFREPEGKQAAQKVGRPRFPACKMPSPLCGFGVSTAATKLDFEGFSMPEDKFKPAENSCFRGDYLPRDISGVQGLHQS
jgi:hypothetical protein